MEAAGDPLAVGLPEGEAVEAAEAEAEGDADVVPLAGQSGVVSTWTFWRLHKLVAKPIVLSMSD